MLHCLENMPIVYFSYLVRWPLPPATLSLRVPSFPKGTALDCVLHRFATLWGWLCVRSHRFATLGDGFVSRTYFHVLILTKPQFERIIVYAIKYFHHIVRIMW